VSALRVVLGDQLTPGLSSLRGIDPVRDVVLTAEVWDETTYFLLRHRDALDRNPRLALAYRTLAAMTEERRADITDHARKFLASPEMNPG